MTEGKIYETPWMHSLNQLVEVKHLYARKGNKVFVTPAYRTKGVGYLVVPTVKNSQVEMEYQDPEDTEDLARDRIQAWLT